LKKAIFAKIIFYCCCGFEEKHSAQK